MPAKVLLVEDCPDSVRVLEHALRSATLPFLVTSVATMRAALRALTDERPDCVVIDYRLPDGDGLEVLRRLRQDAPDLPVVMITGAGSEELAVEAMKLGASDYLPKDGRYVFTLPQVLHEALGQRELRGIDANGRAGAGRGERESADEREQRRREFQAHGILATSPEMDAVLEMVELSAPSHAPLLIEGESGTGKDLIARAVHQLSRRSPYVAINCAAVPEGLLESELFGHERGAFTGADRSRPGLFVQASGGTLFLDEVGEMSVGLQAKLLRVLEEKEVRPLGGSAAKRIDVRILAATNIDLRKASGDGRFRLDLYHRLAVLQLRIPPLRERTGDVRLLAEHFLEDLSRDERKVVVGFEAEAIRLLERHAWPGNARELQNEIHRLVVCAKNGERIRVDALSPWIRDDVPRSPVPGRPLREVLREVEAATIRSRLRENGYQRTATARSLGITREALWVKLRQLGFALPVRDKEAH
jgi:two-component system response regulator AtoC